MIGATAGDDDAAAEPRATPDALRRLARQHLQSPRLLQSVLGMIAQSEKRLPEARRGSGLAPRRFVFDIREFAVERVVADAKRLRELEAEREGRGARAAPNTTAKSSATGTTSGGAGAMGAKVQHAPDGNKGTEGVPPGGGEGEEQLFGEDDFDFDLGKNPAFGGGSNDGGGDGGGGFQVQLQDATEEGDSDNDDDWGL